MAHREFILQGFTPRTHAAAVRELLGIQSIERVVLSVAFVNESGVELIAGALAPLADRTTVFAGIRNDITSHQGLTKLHEMGVDLYTVDTGSRNIIFHPKLYLVRNPDQARLIVGSANLTLGGLNNNIEAGMVLGFDLHESDDKAAVTAGIEAQLDALPGDYPRHVVRVTASPQLDEFLAAGLLVDEMALPPPHPGTAARIGARDRATAIALKVVRRRRALLRGTAAPRAAPMTPAAPRRRRAPARAGVPSVPGVEVELVWESKPLTRRDLTIPTAAGTHATGSINLDKGLLQEEVDHRHYFRDEVFEHLAWALTPSGSVEETYAKFQLVLKGISYGEFDLRIAHTTSTTSRSYQQRNAMTRLSWGPMRDRIAHEDLIDRTLALYRDRADPTRFVLEID
jgi:hypothetical protein